MVDINEFHALYGDDAVEYLQSIISKNNLTDEFQRVLNNQTELFNFAIKYGLYPIVHYLYIHKGVHYDLNTITNYVQCLTSDNNENLISAESNGIHNKLHIVKLDQYTENRNACINFLLTMRKYSTCTTKNKHFLYRFNPKYRQTIIISM